MRQFSQVALTLAILLTVIALCASGYCIYALLNHEFSRPQAVKLPLQSVRDVPKGQITSSNPAPIDIPDELMPQVMGLLSGVKVSPSDLGFVAYFPPDPTSSMKGREVVAVGISTGSYGGSVILPSPKGAVVAMPNALFVPDPQSWPSDYPLISQKMIEFLNTQLKLEEGTVAQGGGLSIYSGNQLATDESFGIGLSNTTFLYSYNGRTYSVDETGLKTYNADIEKLIMATSDAWGVPFAPPILNLAILAGIFILAFIILIFRSSHDLAVASLAAIIALAAVGGATLIAPFLFPTNTLFLAAVLGAGLLWSFAIIGISAAFGLDLTLGWFWLVYSLLSSGLVLQSIFPAKWVWAGFEIASGLIVIGLLLSMLAKRPNRRMPSKGEINLTEPGV